MVELRITKYDPACRDATGSFTRCEWTSVTDIGREICGSILTVDGYLAVEKQYIAYAERLMQKCGVSNVYISGLEVYGCDNLPSDLRGQYLDEVPCLSEGQRFSSDSIAHIVRLVLREVAWCRLHGDRSFYLHFGYDYYMYAGFDGDIAEVSDIATDLYVEEFRSPYNETDA